jgi:hypothetical protein
MSYGPKLTPAELAKLQREISDFKANEVENTKKLRAEIECEAVGKESVDAYEYWTVRAGGKEDIEANPDQLLENVEQPWGTTIDDKLGLSELEKDAWELCKEMGYTAADAAIELGVTKHSIHQAMKRAGLKLRGKK